MTVDVEVEVYNPASDPEAEGLGGPLVLDLYGGDAGLLIGRRGATLHDLQSMVTTMVSRSLGRYIPVRVDVEGYQQRQLDRAEQLALRAADRVRQRRRPITLDPMSPAERRVVHTTLADDDAVETQSSGEGDERRVTVSLRGGGYGGPQGGRGRGGGPRPEQRGPAAAPPPQPRGPEPDRPAFDDELGPMADDEE